MIKQLALPIHTLEKILNLPAEVRLAAVHADANIVTLVLCDPEGKIPNNDSDHAHHYAVEATKLGDRVIQFLDARNGRSQGLVRERTEAELQNQMPTDTNSGVSGR